MEYTRSNGGKGTLIDNVIVECEMRSLKNLEVDYINSNYFSTIVTLKKKAVKVRIIRK